jgi:hypothetical protein
MNGNMVSWQDYDGIDGFGSATQSDVDELNKALKAGQDINPPGSVTAGDGFALRVESLERTLKNLTFRMEHIKLWKAITKLAAYNTVEEHNVLHNVGQNNDAGWIDEGDLPNEDDSSYERKFAVVKYIGTVRRVTHVMSLVRPAHQNVIAAETVNGTMHLLRVLEKSLFKARSDLSALQFDGIEKLLLDSAPTTNIIDMRGKPLSEDVLTDGALVISDAPNYGQATDLFINPRVKADLVKAFFPKERYDLFTKKTDGLVGLDIAGFTSPAGDVRFQSDVFIDDGGGTPTAAVGDATKIPATPTQSTPATSPGDALSKFTADDAGDYYYRAVACNRYGKSAPRSIEAGAVTIAAGDKVTFGLTPGSAVTVSWYEIYRTAKSGAAGTARLILRVPNAGGAGEQIINDYNNYLPGCTTAYLLQQNAEALSFKQLAPMVKIPLATVDSSIRWMQLIYGVPVVYAYGRHVLYINVGRAEGSVGV